MKTERPVGRLLLIVSRTRVVAEEIEKDVDFLMDSV